MTSSPRLGPALDLIHSCLWALRCSSPAVTTCGHSIASNSMNNKLLQTPVHESQQHGQPELLQTLTQRQTNIGSGTAIRSFTSNSWLASDLPNGPEHLVPSFCGLQAPPCFASPAANLRHVYQIPDQTIERICISLCQTIGRAGSHLETTSSLDSRKSRNSKSQEICREQTWMNALHFRYPHHSSFPHINEVFSPA